MRMNNLWDYDKKELEKTELGRIKILERMINFEVYLKNIRKDFTGRHRFLKFIIKSRGIDISGHYRGGGNPN